MTDRTHLPPSRPRRLAGAGALVGVAAALSVVPAAGAATTCSGVSNPTTGACLHVEVFRPTSGVRAPIAVVLVPGAAYDSTTFTTDGTAQAVADGRYTVVVFDPDGRGSSTGVEESNGHNGQDGLDAVVDFAAGLPGVTTVGILSTSYGISLSTGALARHADSPAAFLIDWEGPSSRLDNAQCNGTATSSRPRVVDCTDEAWWAEREAVNFVDDLDVPYLRLQSRTDHVQPDYDHAVAMINSALDGSAPWVGLNNTEVTAGVSSLTAGELMPDSLERPASAMYLRALGTIVGHL